MRRILAFSIGVLGALDACRPAASPAVTPEARVASVPDRPATLVVGAERNEAPCAAKIDRSSGEPFVIETRDPPRRARVVVRPLGAEPSSDMVLVVPVQGGFVEHVLGNFGNAECDEKLGARVEPMNGVLHVGWTVEHVRLTSMHPHDESPCEEIGVGDCTLGCKKEGDTTHHLFVDEQSGRRLLAVEVERVPAEGIVPPEVSFDAAQARVTVRGSGCLESISLR